MTKKTLDIVKVYEATTSKAQVRRNSEPEITLEVNLPEKNLKMHISEVVKQFLIDYLNAWYTLNFAKVFDQRCINSLTDGLRSSISSLFSNFSNYRVEVNCTWEEFPADYNILIYKKDEEKK